MACCSWVNPKTYWDVLQMDIQTLLEMMKGALTPVIVVAMWGFHRFSPLVWPPYLLIQDDIDIRVTLSPTSLSHLGISLPLSVCQRNVSFPGVNLSRPWCSAFLPPALLRHCVVWQATLLSRHDGEATRQRWSRMLKERFPIIAMLMSSVQFGCF